MRYMMLIHHDEAALATAPQKEFWAEYGAFNEALNKAGAGMALGRTPPAGFSGNDRAARQWQDRRAGWPVCGGLSTDEAVRAYLRDKLASSQQG